MIKMRQNDFEALRKAHPLFTYQSCTAAREGDLIRMNWLFHISPDITFQARLDIPLSFFNTDTPELVLQELCFQLGLVEMISYWKTACPPLIKIEAGKMSETSIPFWKELFYLGLGEFRFLNGIHCEKEDFVNFDYLERAPLNLAFPTDENRVLIPVGGGKDSAVTLSLLHQTGQECIPFMINPLPASFRCLHAAGISEEKAIIFQRHLDPSLLQLNAAGYLNGHTPFSALLAFSTLIASAITGAGQIALSNESSANEASIPGTDINHQYSKSYAFEEMFRRYMTEELGIKPMYFSFLRPLNELQIAALFAGMPEFHTAFLSCNVGSKQDRWCGECPKCLFTATILSPFLSRDEIRNILGTDIFENIRLYPTLLELAGWADNKPFECVGTIEEVRASLDQAFSSQTSPPALIRKIHGHLELFSTDAFGSILRQENPSHALNTAQRDLLFNALQSRIDETGW